MRFIRIIIILLIIIAFAIIYTQNTSVFTQQFELKIDLNKYVIGPYITKNVVIILISFAVGAILALIMGAFQAASGKAALKSRIRELEVELAEARESMPTPASPQSSDSDSSSPFSPPS